jgi:hypothetical protein
MLALGVGHACTLPCDFLTSLPAIAEASSSVNSPLSQCFLMILTVPSHGIMDAVGVGSKNPDSVALMWGSNIGCSHNSPFTVIPHLGKVSNDSDSSPNSEDWGVFHKDVLGSYFANHPRHFVPHGTSLAFEAISLSADTDVLTRKASRYDLSNASPRSSVKGANVIPDRESFEKTVILSGAQYACGIGFPLDCTDGSPPKQVSGKYSSTSTRE